VLVARNRRRSLAWRHQCRGGGARWRRGGAFMHEGRGQRPFIDGSSPLLQSRRVDRGAWPSRGAHEASRRAARPSPARCTRGTWHEATHAPRRLLDRVQPRDVWLEARASMGGGTRTPRQGRPCGHTLGARTRCAPALESARAQVGLESHQSTPV
jgi:hypothetical protein